jgi:predicted phosphodiesterase
VAPVDLLVVPGNHDRELTTWLRVWCEDAYRDAPDVAIHHHESGRVYVRHGACLIGVTHGDTAKAAQLPGLMADEAPDQADVWHRHWIIGHLHRYEVSERAGGSITTAPAMTRPNPWALQHFGHGRRAAVALAYHADRGHCATFVERP